MTRRTTLWVTLATVTLLFASSSASASPFESLLSSTQYGSLQPVARGFPKLMSDGPLTLGPFTESMHLAISMRLPDLVKPQVGGASILQASGALSILWTPNLKDLAPAPRPILFGVDKKVDPVDPPLEGEDKEIQILPSLITFFCNPYALEKDGGRDKGMKFSMDKLKEINLGVMGEINGKLRIALFSTLSMSNMRGETGFDDRESLVQERMTHRFSLLFSVSPAPQLFLGAAGGAKVVETPRAYTFELLFEARARF